VVVQHAVGCITTYLHLPARPCSSAHLHRTAHIKQVSEPCCVRRPPPPQGVLRWASVETALLEGCERVRDILDYISKESLPPSSSSLSSSGVQAQAPPLVTREHLSRSLSAWVADGRLERRARGRYRLVHTESRL
jgi:hypothetical protein